MCIVYLTNGKQIVANSVYFEQGVCHIGDACYSSFLIEDVVPVTEENCWKYM